MHGNNVSRITHHASRYSPYGATFHTREWAILGLFSCLTLIMLLPLSIHPSSMVPEPTDPLLNVWRMQWNARAFLAGPDGIANLFNTNIFYPFPLTLAYSEHFLMIAAQALPFLLVANSHLVGLNLSALITFILSGYAMYLLVTDWTGHRWAGLLAGVLFAFSPHRFGQLNHLELLVTQWMPLTLLALHWTLIRPGLRYPLLFGLFFNLQALSGFHFSLNLTLACLLLALIYTLTGRVYWRPGLWIAAVLSILVTLLLNWPVWRMYLRFSDVMGAVRTPGEVRIYSAALTDYLTTIPHNRLYGWTFGRWQAEGHQFQPLMPVGVVGLLLALIGMVSQLSIVNFRRRRPKFAGQVSKDSSPRFKTRNTQSCPERSRRDATRNTQQSTYAFPTIIFLLLLTFLSLLLSFGLNENALGPGLAPLLRFSPYFWLYDHVSFFQGIRVPGRFGVLAVLGLVGLAGWGVARILPPPAYLPPPKLAGQVSKIVNRKSKIVSPVLGVGLTILILLESWSVPLIGPEFPAGQDIPPVYHWLRDETPADTVVLELPFQGPSEFIYEHYSSYHWRRMANGGTGFTPPIYKTLRQWFNAFPEARSVDLIQQMGIGLVILHPDSYQPDAWQRVLADLPLYLPAVEQINQVGDALVFRIAKSFCQPEPDVVQATLTPAELDDLPNAISVTYHNGGSAAFVADVRQISHLTVAGRADRNFTEPLVTPAGEAQAVIVPLRSEQPASHLTGAWLATLERTISVDQAQTLPLSSSPVEAAEGGQWQPLSLNFADGPQLIAYTLTDPATACNVLTIALNWAEGQAGDTAMVQLLDPFGRVVMESMTQPWTGDAEDTPDLHTLPLVGSLPAGRYGLRVSVWTATGTERLPITEAGITIPTEQIPPLPVVIHPAPRSLETGQTLSPPPLFGNVLSLLGRQLAQERVSAGDWLRFSLVWRAEQPLDTELTVFTQLLGPEGQVWGQRDNQPGGGWYGLPLWPPGQPVIDDYAFQLQPDAPPGTYRLIVGLYRSDTLERLPVQSGGDFVEIATVVVE